jgi:diguanylate cyclase (GGDEF)-like protein
LVHSDCPSQPQRSATASREVLTGAVAVAAIILFVGTYARLAASLSHFEHADPVAAVAVLLNIALILFAWLRHKAATVASAQHRAAEEKAHRFATRDQLTNLLVRSSLIEAGREAVRNALEAERPAAVIVLNLDRFKHVNEVYGHRAGDALLRSVSDILVATARDALLSARIGADEFCLLCPITEAAEKEVTRLAERLLQLLSRPFEIDTVPIHVSASVGMARLAAGGEFETLLRQANIAMTAAKKAGGNRAIWFDASMESALKARTEIESGLRRGIPLGEFVPYYQPQVDLRTGRICGFEALARWNHPAGGVVGPDVFIPVAEETGLIADLFDSLCWQALADAKEWDPDLTLAVNISPSQLKDPWLAQRILKLLTAAGFPADRLEVEITESSLFENLALAQAIVASLKNQGVRLALDDFGTGYSSLANLRALPFDRIKIDRSFVQAMQTDRESLAIATAIAKMGESLGVPVTAEGVTGEEVRQQLLEIGCDKGQGWLFGKPLAQPEARVLLALHGQLASTPLPAPDNAAAPAPAPRRRAAGR